MAQPMRRPGMTSLMVMRLWRNKRPSPTTISICRPTSTGPGKINRSYCPHTTNNCQPNSRSKKETRTVNQVGCLFNQRTKHLNHAVSGKGRRCAKGNGRFPNQTITPPGKPTRIPSPIQTLTVGPGVTPDPPLHNGSRAWLALASPPVGNCTLPRRNYLFVIIVTMIIANCPPSSKAVKHFIVQNGPYG